MFELRPILSTLLRHKSGTLLLVLQIAITFSVVVNAISIIDERISMANHKSGLAEEQMFSFSMWGYLEGYDEEQNMRADIELIRNIPGVIDAVHLNQVPLSGNGDASGFAASQADLDNRSTSTAGVLRTDHHGLNTLGVRLLEGRNFQEDEVVSGDSTLDANVALITKSLADKLFPGESALNKTLYAGTNQSTIIGVVEHMVGFWAHASFFNDNVIYPEFSQQRTLVRVETGSLDEVMGGIEQRLLDRDPNRVVSRLRTMSEMREFSYRGDTAMVTILWTVIVLLVAITGLGVVGSVSFSVNQRIKQIGTRRALGARKIDIQRYFLTENILINAIGLSLGTALAIGVNILLVDSFSVSPMNWVFIPVGLCAMFLLGLASVWFPAQKAAGISPAIATQSI